MLFDMEPIMKYSIALTLLSLAVALPAEAQTSPPAGQVPIQKQPPYTLLVNFTGFNTLQKTFTGEVLIHATPCRQASYNILLEVVGVKDSEEALDRVKGDIERVADNISKEADRCKPAQ
jgi:hypothetical protein